MLLMLMLMLLTMMLLTTMLKVMVMKLTLSLVQASNPVQWIGVFVGLLPRVD